jgi:hypothetical protein
VQKLKWITILALWFAAASLLAEAAPQVTDTRVVDASFRLTFSPAPQQNLRARRNKNHEWI